MTNQQNITRPLALAALLTVVLTTPASAVLKPGAQCNGGVNTTLPSCDECGDSKGNKLGKDHTTGPYYPGIPEDAVSMAVAIGERKAEKAYFKCTE